MGSVMKGEVRWAKKWQSCFGHPSEAAGPPVPWRAQALAPKACRAPEACAAVRRCAREIKGQRGRSRGRRGPRSGGKEADETPLNFGGGLLPPILVPGKVRFGQGQSDRRWLLGGAVPP